MLFEKYLMPDFMFEKFDAITPQFLKENEISCLLIDIDNTLAPYETETADERIKAWFDILAQSGIVCALISNNCAERVEKFNRELALPAFPDAKKPSIKYYLKALDLLAKDKEHTAVLGDQLLTDAWSGRRLSAKVIIVPPIRDKRTLFFKFKRAIEKPYINKFKKANSQNS